MRNVSLDEQRHIGFGVKLLADLYREDPGPIQDAIVGLIKEVLPWTSAVAKPPNWDRSYTECFGFTLEDLGEAGATSIEQRLRAIGLPSTPSPASRCRWTSRRASAPSAARSCCAPGSSGRATTASSRTPRRSRSCSTRSAAGRSPTACGPGTTIEWDFADAAPWHVVLDNGGSRAVQGRARAGRPDAARCASPTGPT